MNISLRVFGIEIATLDVDVNVLEMFTDDTPQSTPVDKAIGRISAWWVKRGMK